ncbi:DENN domain-containing protein 2D isoform X1 [Anolis carolinensis]|uniref:DENN domain containing 2D n=2 Tax=Anolis carolinensis TaxID=28377 RepID=G1KD24_ANOCA|nr:PREDICTED: DENN domain-containing protein 2D isoform X1 [Anolis carolinensis]|eukprot:XP_003220568.1 PREDICTED: DENN domain-containing protein 2D isoform X1 [Anolis carolinensis]
MAGESIARFFRHSFRRRSSRGDEAQGALPNENRPAVGERTSFPNSVGHLFFEYLIVVSLKKNTKGDYEPKITYQFPKRENLMRGQREEEERLLQAIPLFCFPDGNEWAPLMECKSETFSFVLTNVDGSRKIGYCRRLLPSGRGARLPEVYCIVSCLGCFGLFSKILDEVEKRRQISTAVIYPFMQGLRESPFPSPGKTVTIKSFIPDSGTEQIELTRPLDSHLEHVEFQALLQHLSPEKILLVFASAVLERRLIFLAEELSSLSKCIHAAAALLYPFNWAHTYIPVVPEKLLSTVCCPTPFMVGIQKRYLDEVLDQPMEEVLLVDLSEGKFLRVVGDEEEILPAKLQSEMLSSLPTINNNIQTPEELNVCVSDAFVQFFVKTIGHYPAHIKWNRSGQGCFQERAFCKAPTSKTTRKFLKRFVKTQIFSLFIQEAEQSKKCLTGYFQKRLNEYQEQKKQRRLS